MGSNIKKFKLSPWEGGSKSDDESGLKGSSPQESESAELLEDGRRSRGYGIGGGGRGASSKRRGGGRVVVERLLRRAMALKKKKVSEGNGRRAEETWSRRKVPREGKSEVRGGRGDVHFWGRKWFCIVASSVVHEVRVRVRINLIDFLFTASLLSLFGRHRFWRLPIHCLV